jgi:sugar/nucleoside kinase (ribokinase family)
MWDTVSQKKAILYAMELAKKHGTKIVFDVADPFCVSRNRDEFKKIIANSDIVFANKEEAKILFDIDNPEKAVKHLSDRCEIGIVKVGKDGAFIGHNGKIIKIKGRKVDAIDTTGAGDSFAAGFIFGLCSNYSIAKAGVFASYLASEIVTQKGAQFSDEVLNKIKKDLKSGAWEYTK